MAKRWEQSLQLKEGSLRKELGISGDKKIPLDKLYSLKTKLHNKAKKGKLTPGELALLRRVNLAIQFKTQ